MKPIRLDIAGLQSYRETQTVDFERLCQGGVFGIFGPTGSGKSSILDAMTLALYGKVERAAKGTQGIMNGAENKLSVSLTFELSGAGESERYRVERQYKRSGETGVHGVICRLIHMRPEGDVVLADKQNEVDDAVTRLIGLAMPDFTRAVVLPQGKFAEFLTLAGKDRRSMLQRLFRLERYGDTLAAKLSFRSDKVKLSLKEAEAEQQGLGDASPDMLAAAAAQLAEAREAAAALRLRLAEVEARHAELSRRREREAELKRIEDELAVLAERADEMNAMELRLERLRKAGELAAVLRDADEAAAAAESGRVAHEEASSALAVRAAAAGEAADGWDRIRAESEKQEPELLVKLERLEQALQIERECEDLVKQQSVLAEELARMEAEQSGLAASLAEQEDLLARGRTKQAALKEQLAARQPLAERHAHLQAAVSRLEQRSAWLIQAEEAGKEAEDHAAKAAAAESRLRNVEAVIAEAVAEGWMQSAWWSGLSAELTRFRQESAACLQAMAADVERLRAQQRESERAELARVLAENLNEGEPCPVCGSLAHPAGPVIHSDSLRVSADPVSDELNALNESIRGIEQWDREAGSAAERSHWYAGRLSERLREHHPESGPELSMDQSFKDEAAPTAALVETPAIAQDIGIWSERWNRLSVRVGELSDRQDRWESKLAEAVKELAQARESVAAAAGLAEQTGTRRSKLAEQAAALLEDWQAQFPDLLPEQAAQQVAEAASAERETRDLRERLETSVGFLEEQERKRRETEGNGHAVSLRVAETAARKTSVDTACAAAAARLREWTGGESPAVLAEQTKERLNRLRAAAAESKQRAEITDRERQEAQRLLDTAAERDKAAGLAKERGFRRLAEGLDAAGFTSPEEVRQLLPDVPGMAALKEQLDTYRKAEMQFTAQRKLLREQMTGDAVPPEEWEQATMLKESLRVDTEQALALCAKAERDVEDLMSRRERWEVLETRRVALADESSRIARLQSVFRGNAFVEYIAEEQLEQVCRAASERLGFLTRRRYALEVDAGGGFVIRDDANGGVRRPVSTLSGGETFLTSLALALALSAEIQLRGKYPLQFFFLDEGFGTLDPELLDTVVTSLEKLQHSSLAVGVISHVPELQARLPRRLHVAAAEPGGRGSRITYETM